MGGRQAREQVRDRPLGEQILGTIRCELAVHRVKPGEMAQHLLLDQGHLSFERSGLFAVMGKADLQGEIQCLRARRRQRTRGQPHRVERAYKLVGWGHRSPPDWVGSGQTCAALQTALGEYAGTVNPASLGTTFSRKMAVVPLCPRRRSPMSGAVPSPRPNK